MRRLAIRSAAAPAWHTVLVIVLMALVGLPLAHALDVVRSQRALADVSTRLAPAPGAPSGSPVTLISPPMAWIAASYPARCAYGPSWP